MYRMLTLILVIAGCTSQSVPRDSTELSPRCYSLTGKKIDISDQNERFIPIFAPAPRYPAKAEIRALSGYAILEFDIVKGGLVENLRVVESCPARLFDKTSLKAGAGLRYGIEPDGKKLERIEGVMYKYSYAGFGH